MEFTHIDSDPLAPLVAGGDHDEEVFCLLDFNLLFVAILLVTTSLGQHALPRFPLSFALYRPNLAVAAVDLPGPYPPPRF